MLYFISKVFSMLTCHSSLLYIAYLDAIKGVMSNSKGKETYVVIFLRSFAECSNRWRWSERRGRGERRGGKGERENKRGRGR